jgi:hypothetical protein
VLLAVHPLLTATFAAPTSQEARLAPLALINITLPVALLVLFAQTLILTAISAITRANALSACMATM